MACKKRKGMTTKGSRSAITFLLSARNYHQGSFMTRVSLARSFSFPLNHEPYFIVTSSEHAKRSVMVVCNLISMKHWTRENSPKRRWSDRQPTTVSLVSPLTWDAMNVFYFFEILLRMISYEYVAMHWADGKSDSRNLLNFCTFISRKRSRRRI